MAYQMRPPKHLQLKLEMESMMTDSMIAQQNIFSKSMKLMGNRFQISVVSRNETWANECIDAAVHEIQRIESLLTTFDESSETSLINRNAGMMPVEVSRETF